MPRPTLTAHEARVLGVLVEKALTTPAQYPLSVNAIVSGCNQKNNRLPVLALNEEDVVEALDGLRAKQLSREVMLSGSRVEKHRHVAREAMEVSTSELVVLTELLLRGPQTVGEIRGRASRMHPLESIETVTSLLEGLAGREEPLVQAVAPAPGSRAGRFVQLLCRDLHALDASPAGAARAEPQAAAGGGHAGRLEARIAALENEVARLRTAVEALSQAASLP